MRHHRTSRNRETGARSHVLVLNQYALPRERGGGTRHIDLFGRLEGWQPLIVAAGRDHYSKETYETEDRRFRLVWVPPYRGNGPSRAIGWVFYASQAALVGLVHRRLDAVYASSPSLLAPCAGVVVARLRRVPLVVEVRDLWPETIVAAGVLTPGSLVHRILVKMEAWVMRSADHIVAVTPGWEEHFAGLGIDSTAVSVIPNGAEVADFEVAEPRATLRLEAGLNRFTAVYAGAHGPLNGINLILDAAAELNEMDFLLVGSGSAKDGARARAVSEGLTNVRFWDPVPKSELPKILKACDVGVHSIVPLPLFAQGMSPNKLFDYLSAGLPVVSNAQEGLRGVMGDNECGRLGGADDLVSCLRDVAAAGEDQRQRWGERGRQIVSERYSRTAAASALLELLTSLHGRPLEPKC
jgi:glycosyltransferase involved in cell wall biosynthesis